MPHTPGPWTAEKEKWTDSKGIAICSSESDEIVVVIGDEEYPADALDWANARLISKAPEMEALLDEAFYLLIGKTGTEKDRHECSERIAKLLYEIDPELEGRDEDDGPGYSLQELDEVKEIIRDRAACGEWPLPETPAELLAWIEDEAEIQEQQLKDHPNEDDRAPYIKVLRAITAHMRASEIEPAKLPWEAEGRD
jgi:hypothetical protein